MTLKEATQVLASQPEFVYLRFSNGSEDVRRPTWTPGSIVVETRTMHGSQINCTLYSLDEMREATPEEIESFLQAEALPQFSAERNLLQERPLSVCSAENCGSGAEYDPEWNIPGGSGGPLDW